MLWILDEIIKVFINTRRGG
ncbi:hypothetical protein LINPERPRIM_LOCUS21106 [Linum perenne]